jgi:hypothetical protein
MEEEVGIAEDDGFGCGGMNDHEEDELEYKSRNEPEEVIGRP